MDAKKLKIMVIEDEEMLLQAISKKLTASDIEPLTCTTAKQAIDYLKSIDQTPDAIWLDYYLPDMNGLEFMNILKENEKWNKIPVVVVSNSASDQKKNAMLALGVKQYVLKAQYKLDDIIGIIRDSVGQGKKS
jgi:DNA-binding response OmpR family regulator